MLSHNAILSTKSSRNAKTAFHLLLDGSFTGDILYGMKTIGEKLQALLDKRNMTQEPLETASGVAQSAISRYKNNKATPNAVNLKKIADVLEVPIGYFFDEETRPETKRMVVAEMVKSYGDAPATKADIRKVLEVFKEVRKTLNKK